MSGRFADLPVVEDSRNVYAIRSISNPNSCSIRHVVVRDRNGHRFRNVPRKDILFGGTFSKFLGNNRIRFVIKYKQMLWFCFFPPRGDSKRTFEKRAVISVWCSIALCLWRFFTPLERSAWNRPTRTECVGFGSARAETKQQRENR